MENTEQKAVEVVVNKNIKDFTSTSGKKYVFQKVKPMQWLDIMDDVEADEQHRRRKLYPAVIENIIVQPKMTIDDFEDYAELEEVVTAAIRFQRGK